MVKFIGDGIVFDCDPEVINWFSDSPDVNIDTAEHLWPYIEPGNCHW
jgi:hypothetical protein